MAQRNLRKAARSRDVGGLPLMLGVSVRMQERNRHRPETCKMRCREFIRQLSPIERDQNVASSRQPLLRLDHPGVEHIWLHDAQSKDIGARLRADFERVGKTGGHHQHGRIALALEQRVGCDRGTHFYGSDLPGR